MVGILTRFQFFPMSKHAFSARVTDLQFPALFYATKQFHIHKHNVSTSSVFRGVAIHISKSHFPIF